MAKYSYITDKTHNNRKIQVESAKRDGSGKNIENNYAKQNGNYQSLTAGLSNNFDTKKVMVDESAYNFRPTATMGSVELEVGSPCKVKKIIGGTIVFNQLLQNGNFSSVSNWTITGATYSVSNNEAVITMGGSTMNFYQAVAKTSGHKYIMHYKVKASTNISEFTLNWGDKVDSVNITTSYVERYKILTNISGNNNINFNIYQIGSQGDIIYLSNVCLVDLTQMFGSTIADYIYSLEQANAGSGVAWFKRYFPKEYYAYNSGELVSVKTQGKKITHFNQWDEEVIINSGHLETKNYQKCLPNTIYHIAGPIVSPQLFGNGFEFYDIDKNLVQRIYPNSGSNITSPSNAVYFKFGIATSYGSTYNHDICINFHYDGERDGEYEPYNSETYPCDDVELRGIPQLDENNNLAFEGDEYANDGNVTRKYGVVDLSTLSFSYNSASSFQCWYTNDLTDLAVFPINQTTLGKFFSSSFVTLTQNVGLDGTTIGLFSSTSSSSTKSIFIRNGSSTTAPTGYLVYELATTTDENSIPFTEVQECDNWGTEEWLAPTTDTRPCEVPVGHETDYLPDLKAKLEVAPNTPNENGVYVMEHNASGNTYTLIGAWLTDNGYTKTDNLYGLFGAKKTAGGILRKMLAEKYNIDFKNTAVCDLSELSYSYDASYPNVFSASSPADILLHSFNGDISILCSEFVEIRPVWRNGVGDLEICQVPDNLGFTIKDTRYNNIADFKNAMKGVLLAYAKAS